MQARGKYIIDTKVMQQLRNDAVVLHPLPRVDEVGYDCLYCIVGGLTCSLPSMLLLHKACSAP